MKKSKLRMILRKIVREEVAMAIKEVITELKKPTQQVSQPTQPKPKNKIVEKKSYSKNSVLNDVLNETAVNSDWKSITSNGAGKALNSISTTLSDSYGEMMGQDINVNQMAADEGINPEEVPDHVSDALTRDYSELMGAINKKKEDK